MHFLPYPSMISPSLYSATTALARSLHAVYIQKGYHSQLLISVTTLQFDLESPKVYNWNVEIYWKIFFPLISVETSKRKLKTFLDPKVAQNLGIFLAGFKMDAEELKFRLAILSENNGGLGAEQINMLRR